MVVDAVLYHDGLVDHPMLQRTWRVSPMEAREIQIVSVKCVEFYDPGRDLNQFLNVKSMLNI